MCLMWKPSRKHVRMSQHHDVQFKTWIYYRRYTYQPSSRKFELHIYSLWNKSNKKKVPGTAHSDNQHLCILHRWLAVLQNAECYLDYPIIVGAHQFTLICVIIGCSNLACIHTICKTSLSRAFPYSLHITVKWKVGSSSVYGIESHEVWLKQPKPCLIITITITGEKTKWFCECGWATKTDHVSDKLVEFCLFPEPFV